jgi:glycosyltransferase involved in cell wall biosynthesis
VDWRELARFHRRAWINLAPLERGNPFTAAKSALKYFEAGLFAVPTVASDVPAFASDIRDGANGFLCRTEEEWRAKILRLLADEPLRRAMGARARAHVLSLYTTAARSANLVAILREVLGPERFSAATAPEGRR